MISVKRRIVASLNIKLNALDSIKGESLKNSQDVGDTVVKDRRKKIVQNL